jgi:hypothetical protein
MNFQNLGEEYKAMLKGNLYYWMHILEEMHIWNAYIRTNHIKTMQR